MQARIAYLEKIYTSITMQMEELTPEELEGILEDPRSSREDLLRAAAQLSLRRRAEGRAEGRAEWQLLQQDLLTMSSHKFETILDDMYQQLQKTREQLHLKTRQLEALMNRRSKVGCTIASSEA